MRAWRIIIGCAALTIIGVAAGAQRGIRPAIDFGKPLHLEGRVVRFEWVDPVWIHLDVTVDGRSERWRIKAGTTSLLLRRGWNRNSLPIGTHVVVNGFLADAERKIAWSPEIQLPDGEALWLPNSLNDVDLAGSTRRASSDEKAVPRSCPYTTIGGLPADIGEARRSGDYRPLSVASFWGRDKYPGISCPADRMSRLKRKGGVFYSDAMTSCPAGWDTMKSQIEAQVLAYNRELASWPEFQAETGCTIAE